MTDQDTDNSHADYFRELANADFSQAESDLINEIEAFFEAFNERYDFVEMKAAEVPEGTPETVLALQVNFVKADTKARQGNKDKPARGFIVSIDGVEPGRKPNIMISEPFYLYEGKKSERKFGGIINSAAAQHLNSWETHNLPTLGPVHFKGGLSKFDDIKPQEVANFLNTVAQEFERVYQPAVAKVKQEHFRSG